LTYKAKECYYLLEPFFGVITMAAIYKITCVVTDDFYVGSAVKPKRRRWEHWDSLKKNRHHCAALQRAWNEYGEDAFEFEVVEEVEDEDRLLLIEDMYLAQSAGQTYCYNTALSTQIPCSTQREVREKIGESLKEHYATNVHPRQGKKHTPEAIAKMLANRVSPKGEKHYRYGKTVSEETRKKIGDTQRGKPKGPGRKVSEEGRAKIRAAAEAGHYDHWKGRQHTEESRNKMGRQIAATDPSGKEHLYPTITKLREALGLTPPTVDRALKSGNALTKGKAAGWRFKYLDTP